MKLTKRELGKLLFSGGLLTPAGWLFRATALIVAFTIVHALGWRDDTRVISGTSALPSLTQGGVAIRGTLYALFYFAAVIISPILLIAAAGLFVLRRANVQKSFAVIEKDAQGVAK